MTTYEEQVMEHKVLAKLVAGVIETGESTQLTAEERQRFYREFESGVSLKVDEMRTEKKRAYEEMKSIAIG